MASDETVQRIHTLVWCINSTFRFFSVFMLFRRIFTEFNLKTLIVPKNEKKHLTINAVVDVPRGITHSLASSSLSLSLSSADDDSTKPAKPTNKYVERTKLK